MVDGANSMAMSRRAEVSSFWSLPLPTHQPHDWALNPWKVKWKVTTGQPNNMTWTSNMLMTLQLYSAASCLLDSVTGKSGNILGNHLTTPDGATSGPLALGSILRLARHHTPASGPSAFQPCRSAWVASPCFQRQLFKGPLSSWASPCPPLVETYSSAPEEAGRLCSTLNQLYLTLHLFFSIILSRFNETRTLQMFSIKLEGCKKKSQCVQHISYPITRRISGDTRLLKESIAAAFKINRLIETLTTRSFTRWLSSPSTPACFGQQRRRMLDWSWYPSCGVKPELSNRESDTQ